jgi:hypothetical protein
MGAIVEAITDWTAGDDWDYEREITSVPVGTKLHDAYFVVLPYSNSPDSDALLTGQITRDNDVDNGKITDDDASDGVATVRFIFRRTRTSVVKHLTDYYYKLYVITDDDWRKTVREGRLSP